MDDTFVIQQQGQKQTFLEHINNVDPAIKYTVEGNQENGTFLFLDTLVKPEADNTLSITVCRKPSYTDQYLQWDSHHNLVAMYSVISTHTHRAKTVCTRAELLNKEIHHLSKALTKCKYPKWALDKVERKFLNNSQENSNTEGEPSEEDYNSPSSNTTRRDPNKDKYSKGHTVIPYTQELGESIKNICSKYGIQTHFKGNRTIKEILVKNPKTKILWTERVGPSTGISVGSSHVMRSTQGRHPGPLEKDREPSPIHAHNTQTGHNTNPENFTIIGREDHGIARTIKESIYIRVNNPTLNRNVDKYNLHHIWDRVLLTSLTLKLIMTMGMQTEHPSVGMLSPFQPVGICIEP